MTKTISIIIPVYNLENIINHTLESLINQINDDFEIIIVNDGSTDNTLEVINVFFQKVNFKNYRIINKVNGGVSSARNIGIYESSGEYLYFLDGDDYISNDMISTVRDYIDSYKPDVLIWGYNLVNENHESIFEYFDSYNFDSNKSSGLDAIKAILNENKSLSVCTCSALYRKEIIVENNIKYTEGCTNGEDQEFIFKVLLNAKSVYYIKKVLSFYYQREGSISNSFSIKRFDAISALERVYNYFVKNGINDDYILDYLNNNYIIDNYLYNFKSCLLYLVRKEKLPIKNAVKLLQDKIEICYSGLDDYIRRKIKVANYKSLTANVKHKLYLKSPLLYSIVVLLVKK